MELLGVVKKSEDRIKLIYSNGKDEDYISYKAAAEYTRTKWPTVWKWANQDKTIPYHEFRNKGYVREENILKIGKLYSLTEIAQKLGICRQTLNHWDKSLAPPYNEFLLYHSPGGKNGQSYIPENMIDTAKKLALGIEERVKNNYHIHKSRQRLPKKTIKTNINDLEQELTVTETLTPSKTLIQQKYNQMTLSEIGERIFDLTRTIMNSTDKETKRVLEYYYNDGTADKVCSYIIFANYGKKDKTINMSTARQLKKTVKQMGSGITRNLEQLIQIIQKKTTDIEKQTRISIYLSGREIKKALNLESTKLKY